MMNKESVRKQYMSYEEIPPLIRDYILTVSNEKEITDIALGDINDFLNGLHEYHSGRVEKHIEGWV